MLKTNPRKAAGAFIVIVGLVAAYAFGIHEKGHASAAKPFQAPLPPVEFLYLDGPRILDFLAELEGGQVGKVHRISKEIASVNVGGSGGGFNVGASSQHESIADSTITRTEASELGLLLNDLSANESQGVSFHSIELTKPANVNNPTRLREGMVVRFVTHELLSPGYIRPYVVVRQSATLSALFPQAAGDPVGAERAEEQRQKAESFARQVGPDPRITFFVSPRPNGDEPPLRVLMPMRYHDLTQERSLLEKGRDQYTGGRLVVFGKVIRVFRHESNVPCVDKRKRCPEYTDFATREIWRNPLEQASNFLIEHVSHTCRTRDTSATQAKQTSQTASVEGRACFLAKLKRQTELYAPGAVILPIAIYK